MNIKIFKEIKQSMLQLDVSFDFYIFDIQLNHVISIVRANNISFIFEFRLIFLNFNKLIFQNDNNLT